MKEMREATGWYKEQENNSKTFLF